jgi:hypothetical protein
MYCNIERPAGLISPVLLGSLNMACAPCFVVIDQTGVVGFYVYFSKGKRKKKSLNPEISRTLFCLLKVARRGLYSTAAHCIADCALVPDVVPSSPEAPPHQAAREPSTSEGRNFRRNLARKS